MYLWFWQGCRQHPWLWGGRKGCEAAPLGEHKPFHPILKMPKGGMRRAWGEASPFCHLHLVAHPARAGAALSPFLPTGEEERGLRRLQRCWVEELEPSCSGFPCMEVAPWLFSDGFLAFRKRRSR